jgi:hypothetical protein
MKPLAQLRARCNCTRKYDGIVWFYYVLRVTQMLCPMLAIAAVRHQCMNVESRTSELPCASSDDLWRRNLPSQQSKRLISKSSLVDVSLVFVLFNTQYPT